MIYFDNAATSRYKPKCVVKAIKDSLKHSANPGRGSHDDAIRGAIEKKDKDLKGQMASEGTTPRRLTDLIGSLCDLTSGSGDKGTPIVLVQNYFSNYSD